MCILGHIGTDPTVERGTQKQVPPDPSGLRPSLIVCLISCGWSCVFIDFLLNHWPLLCVSVGRIWIRWEVGVSNVSRMLPLKTQVYEGGKMGIRNTFHTAMLNEGQGLLVRICWTSQTQIRKNWYSRLIAQYIQWKKENPFKESFSWVDLELSLFESLLNT